MSTLLRITSRRDGFRRAGLAHPAAPTDHDAARFTAEQIAALRAEPNLVVVDVLPDAPGPAPTEPGNGRPADALSDPGAGPRRRRRKTPRARDGAA